MMSFSDIVLDFLQKLFSFDKAHPLLFTQFYFWAFFAIVFAVFSLIKNKTLLRNAFLFFVSLFFYYKTSGLFTLILIFITLYNFFGAKWLHSRKKDLSRNIVLAVSVIVNLSILFYFKYAYFITDVVNNLFGSDFKVFDIFSWMGNQMTGDNRFSVDTILLPVGISFYTFQAISYIMDVYRKRIEPVRNILDFGFYVSFFPQLVAGPIVRANEFIPQLHKKYFLSRRMFGIAVFWIMNGLIKKIVLSDYIAVNFIDRVFENPLLYSGFENLCALFGYSLQVYADFSGYLPHNCPQSCLAAHLCHMGNLGCLYCVEGLAVQMVKGKHQAQGSPAAGAEACSLRCLYSVAYIDRNRLFPKFLEEKLPYQMAYRGIVRFVVDGDRALIKAFLDLDGGCHPF